MGSSSKKSTQTTVYGSTKTANPYVVSKTNNKGTISDFVGGSALDTINNFVNSNIGNILNDYLNPSLNSTTNKSLLNSYINNLNSSANASFENNIINPLSERRMLRSSSLQNMVNNHNNNLNSNISGYISELLADSQQNSASMLNNLLNAYMKGFDVIKENQAQSLKTSQGNATVSNRETSGASALDYVNTVSSLLKNAAPYFGKKNKDKKKK